jgi:MFS family permease
MLLTLGVVAAAYARTAVSPLQETLRAALSLSDAQMGLLQGPALALPMLVAGVPLGLAIDRCSRVRLLLIFAVVEVLGSFLTAVASNFTMLFLARCVVGLTVVAISTTAFSLLADLYEPAHRGRASMVIVIGQFGGMSASFALGGALLAFTGALAEGWRVAMVGLSVPLLLAVVAAWLMREPARTDRVIENPTTRASFRELWRYRAVIAPLLLGLIMAEIAVLGTLAWAAPVLSRSFTLAPDRVGAIMASMLLVSGVLGPLAGGLLADVCQRWGGPRQTIRGLIVLALLSTPAGLFAVVPHVGFAILLLGTFMTTVGAIVVAGTTLFTIVVPNELRGLCLATLSTAIVIFGVALAPVLVSLLSAEIGGPAMIGQALAIVCVVSGLLGTASFAFGCRFFSMGA